MGPKSASLLNEERETAYENETKAFKVSSPSGSYLSCIQSECANRTRSCRVRLTDSCFQTWFIIIRQLKQTKPFDLHWRRAHPSPVPLKGKSEKAARLVEHRRACAVILLKVNTWQGGNKHEKHIRLEKDQQTNPANTTYYLVAVFCRG